jgi:F-type H+-transporting ATPase subunit alpha
MEGEFDVFWKELKEEAGKRRFSFGVTEEGTVLSVGDEVAQVAGLRDAKLYELIQFQSGDEGMVFDLDKDVMGVVLLTGHNGIKAGEKAYKTERIASVNAGGLCR